MALTKENDPEEMEGAEHPHNENAGSDPHRDCSDETGEVADPVIVEDIEPGIYYGISNENYHAGPGVSKSQLDDIADTPALYLWRKNAPVDTTKTKTLDLGTAFHCRVLEPEEFSNRFIVAPEFNRRTNAGKEEEKLSWLRQILEWQRDMSDNREFLSLIKGDLDLFAEDV